MIIAAYVLINHADHFKSNSLNGSARALARVHSGGPGPSSERRGTAYQSSSSTRLPILYLEEKKTVLLKWLPWDCCTLRLHDVCLSLLMAIIIKYFRSSEAVRVLFRVRTVSIDRCGERLGRHGSRFLIMHAAHGRRPTIEHCCEFNPVS